MITGKVINVQIPPQGFGPKEGFLNKPVTLASAILKTQAETGGVKESKIQDTDTFVPKQDFT